MLDIDFFHTDMIVLWLQLKSSFFLLFCLSFLRVCYLLHLNVIHLTEKNKTKTDRQRFPPSFGLQLMVFVYVYMCVGACVCLSIL